MKILSSKKRSVRFEIKNLSLKKDSLKQIFNIGIPAALTQVLLPI
jgi:Na+-driven multidrug efflux pump